LAKQNRKHPTRKAIVLAQLKIIEARGLNIADAGNHCWACYHGPIDKLIRAHIVPYAHSQNDNPSNFFLLCDYCHRIQPDTASRFVQIEWLKRAESSLERANRHFIPVMKSIIDLCEQLNDNSLFEKYASEKLPKEKSMSEYMQEHKQNFQNSQPNGGYALNQSYSFNWFALEGFIQWLKENNYDLSQLE
jgi:hypothetical protein